MACPILEGKGYTFSDPQQLTMNPGDAVPTFMFTAIAQVGFVLDASLFYVNQAGNLVGNVTFTQNGNDVDIVVSLNTPTWPTEDQDITIDVESATIPTPVDRTRVVTIYPIGNYRTWFLDDDGNMVFIGALGYKFTRVGRCGEVFALPPLFFDIRLDIDGDSNGNGDDDILPDPDDIDVDGMDGDTILKPDGSYCINIDDEFDEDDDESQDGDEDGDEEGDGTGDGLDIDLDDAGDPTDKDDVDPNDGGDDSVVVDGDDVVIDDNGGGRSVTITGPPGTTVCVDVCCDGTPFSKTINEAGVDADGCPVITQQTVTYQDNCTTIPANGVLEIDFLVPPLQGTSCKLWEFKLTVGSETTPRVVPFYQCPGGDITLDWCITDTEGLPPSTTQTISSSVPGTRFEAGFLENMIAPQAGGQWLFNDDTLLYPTEDIDGETYFILPDNSCWSTDGDTIEEIFEDCFRTLVRTNGLDLIARIEYTAGGIQPDVPTKLSFNADCIGFDPLLGATTVELRIDIRNTVPAVTTSPSFRIIGGTANDPITPTTIVVSETFSPLFQGQQGTLTATDPRISITPGTLSFDVIGNHGATDEIIEVTYSNSTITPVPEEVPVTIDYIEVDPSNGITLSKTRQSFLGFEGDAFSDQVTVTIDKELTSLLVTTDDPLNLTTTSPFNPPAESTITGVFPASPSSYEVLFTAVVAPPEPTPDPDPEPDPDPDPDPLPDDPIDPDDDGDDGDDGDTGDGMNPPPKTGQVSVTLINNLDDPNSISISTINPVYYTATVGNELPTTFGYSVSSGYQPFNAGDIVATSAVGSTSVTATGVTFTYDGGIPESGIPGNIDVILTGTGPVIDPPPVSGCTTPGAVNYDPLAVIDDGSCIFPDPPQTGEWRFKFLMPEGIILNDGDGVINSGTELSFSATSDDITSVSPAYEVIRFITQKINNNYSFTGTPGLGYQLAPGQSPYITPLVTLDEARTTVLNLGDDYTLGWNLPSSIGFSTSGLNQNTQSSSISGTLIFKTISFSETVGIGGTVEPGEYTWNLSLESQLLTGPYVPVSNYRVNVYEYIDGFRLNNPKSQGVFQQPSGTKGEFRFNYEGHPYFSGGAVVFGDARATGQITQDPPNSGYFIPIDQSEGDFVVQYEVEDTDVTLNIDLNGTLGGAPNTIGFAGYSIDVLDAISGDPVTEGYDYWYDTPQIPFAMNGPIGDQTVSFSEIPETARVTVVAADDYEPLTGSSTCFGTTMTITELDADGGAGSPGVGTPVANATTLFYADVSVIDPSLPSKPGFATSWDINNGNVFNTTDMWGAELRLGAAEETVTPSLEPVSKVVIDQDPIEVVLQFENTESFRIERDVTGVFSVSVKDETQDIVNQPRLFNVDQSTQQVTLVFERNFYQGSVTSPNFEVTITELIGSEGSDTTPTVIEVCVLGEDCTITTNGPLVYGQGHLVNQLRVTHNTELIFASLPPGYTMSGTATDRTLSGIGTDVFTITANQAQDDDFTRTVSSTQDASCEATYQITNELGPPPSVEVDPVNADGTLMDIPVRVDGTPDLTKFSTFTVIENTTGTFVGFFIDADGDNVGDFITDTGWGFASPSTHISAVNGFSPNYTTGIGLSNDNPTKVYGVSLEANASFFPRYSDYIVRLGYQTYDAITKEVGFVEFNRGRFIQEGTVPYLTANIGNANVPNGAGESFTFTVNSNWPWTIVNSRTDLWSFDIDSGGLKEIDSTVTVTATTVVQNLDFESPDGSVGRHPGNNWVDDFQISIVMEDIESGGITLDTADDVPLVLNQGRQVDSISIEDVQTFILSEGGSITAEVYEGDIPGWGVQSTDFTEFTVPPVVTTNDGLKIDVITANENLNDFEGVVTIRSGGESLINSDGTGPYINRAIFTFNQNGLNYLNRVDNLGDIDVPGPGGTLVIKWDLPLDNDLVIQNEDVVTTSDSGTQTSTTTIPANNTVEDIVYTFTARSVDPDVGQTSADPTDTVTIIVEAGGIADGVDTPDDFSDGYVDLTINDEVNSNDGTPAGYCFTNMGNADQLNITSGTSYELSAVANNDIELLSFTPDLQFFLVRNPQDGTEVFSENGGSFTISDWLTITVQNQMVLYSVTDNDTSSIRNAQIQIVSRCGNDSQVLYLSQPIITPEVIRDFYATQGYSHPDYNFEPEVFVREHSGSGIAFSNGRNAWMDGSDLDYYVGSSLPFASGNLQGPATQDDGFIYMAYNHPGYHSSLKWGYLTEDTAIFYPNGTPQMRLGFRLYEDTSDYLLFQNSLTWSLEIVYGQDYSFTLEIPANGAGQSYGAWYCAHSPYKSFGSGGAGYRACFNYESYGRSCGCANEFDTDNHGLWPKEPGGAGNFRVDDFTLAAEANRGDTARPIVFKLTISTAQGSIGVLRETYHTVYQLKNNGFEAP